MSLLLSAGHASARRYPFAVVWTEAQLARERMNNMLASEVTLMHMAMASILSKSGPTQLKKELKRLQNG